MTDRKRLRELDQSATPGPWIADKDEVCNYVRTEDGDLVKRIYAEDGIKADAAFIAAANPQAVLELLDENEPDGLVAWLTSPAPPCGADAGGAADGARMDDSRGSK